MIMDGNMRSTTPAGPRVDRQTFRRLRLRRGCRAAFPDLRADLGSAIARLDRGPVKQTIKDQRRQAVEISIAKGAFTTTCAPCNIQSFLSVASRLRPPRLSGQLRTHDPR